MSSTWRASRSTSLTANGLDEATVSVLTEALGISPHQFPDVETDPQVIQFLTDLASFLDTQSKISKAENEEISLLKEEFQHEERRIQEQLKLVGITRDTLSNETQSHVALIARVTEKLQLRQPNYRHILCRWTDLSIQRQTVEERRVGSCFSLQGNAEFGSVSVKRGMRSVMIKSKRMTEKTKDTKTHVMAAYEESMKSVPAELPLPSNAEGKINQYLHDTQHYKSSLEQKGYTPEHSHHAVSEKAQQLEEYRKQITALKTKLKDYDPRLPRNMDAARSCLSDVQSELAQVTEAIRSKIVTDG